MKLFASASPGELRVAAWDGTLHDHAISRPGAPDGVGELHRGRIIARVPAMAGAFVMLDGAEGFLPDSEAPQGGPHPTEGAGIGVRITRAAQGGKGPRLSAKLPPADAALIGTGPPRLLRPGPDALARLSQLHPHAPVQHGDFPDDLLSAVTALEDPHASLPGGARMSVHPTPALVAIDVDLAGATAVRTHKATAQRQGNRAVIPALCRQIRLRNLSGAILVDLAGMSARQRTALAPDFMRGLEPDPLSPRFLGFSALGLAEILRPRIHPPLHELLAGPHASGLAALRRLAREIAAAPHRQPLLRAAPDVAQALRQDSAALADLAHRAGRPLMLKEDRSLPACGWSLEA